LDVADQLRSAIDPERVFNKPGSTEIFGRMVAATDLVEIIGLEQDTNRSQTHRILFLEESVSLFDEERHAHLMRSMLMRYVQAKPPGDKSIPRFLLNDLARYWHTLTIDYQAKTSQHAPYSVRYFKLLLARKFTYLSSVLPLLALGLGSEPVLSQDELADRLTSSFLRPPILRFLDSCRAIQESGGDVGGHASAALAAVESFNGLLAGSDWRKEIELEATASPRSGPRYDQGRTLAKQLQEAFVGILFSPELAPLTQRYLVS
jgi:hypothetical protein